MMVEGSTGGAGLRGLQGDTPTPLELSVLYFDTSHMLQAYDEITLGGTGQSAGQRDRHQDTGPPASPPIRRRRAPTCPRPSEPSAPSR